jgi:ribosomal protein S27E
MTANDRESPPQTPVQCPKCGEPTEVTKGAKPQTWQMRCTSCGHAATVKRSALGIYYTDENHCSAAPLKSNGTLRSAVVLRNGAAQLILRLMRAVGFQRAMTRRWRMQCDTTVFA